MRRLCRWARCCSASIPSSFPARIRCGTGWRSCSAGAFCSPCPSCTLTTISILSGNTFPPMRSSPMRPSAMRRSGSTGSSAAIPKPSPRRRTCSPLRRQRASARMRGCSCMRGETKRKARGRYPIRPGVTKRCCRCMYSFSRRATPPTTGACSGFSPRSSSCSGSRCMCCTAAPSA